MAKETKKTEAKPEVKKEKVEKKQPINFDTSKTYTLEEGVKTLPELSTSKFTGSVNVDIVINLKEKQKKEVIRGSVNFPFAMGDAKKVIVLCEEKDVKKALAAGAVKAGLEDLVEEIVNGYSDFDILIATPSVMPKIVKLGKVLGPKGMMPNPKNGTITTDIEKAVASFMAGKINFKSAQDQPVIRLKIAKLDMPVDSIRDNLIAVIKAVYAETKKFSGNPFKKVTISPTMGAGVKLDINDIIKYI